jgi:hypothetical protein
LESGEKVVVGRGRNGYEGRTDLEVKERGLLLEKGAKSGFGKRGENSEECGFGSEGERSAFGKRSQERIWKKGPEFGRVRIWK